MGMQHLVLYDHVLGARHEGRARSLLRRHTEKDPLQDPFVAFSYLTGLTRNIRFVTGVLIPPQRQTVLVAKQAVDLDLVSRERLHLGGDIG